MRNLIKILVCGLALSAMSCRSVGGKSGVASFPAEKPGLKPLCAEGLSGACAILGQETKALHPVAVRQGRTSTTETEIFVGVKKSDHPVYYVRALGEEGGRRSDAIAEQLTSRRLEVQSQHEAYDQLDISTLKPKQHYELLVLAPEGILLDRREFTGLNPDERRPRLSLITGPRFDANAKGDVRLSATFWSQVIKQNPNLIVLTSPALLSPSGRLVSDLGGTRASGLSDMDPLKPILIAGEGNTASSFGAYGMWLVLGDRTEAVTGGLTPDLPVVYIRDAPRPEGQGSPAAKNRPSLIFSGRAPGVRNLAGGSLEMPALLGREPDGAVSKFSYTVLEIMVATRSELKVSAQTFGPDEKLIQQKTFTVRR